MTKIFKKQIKLQKTKEGELTNEKNVHTQEVSNINSP
jgi:hypothetical protein